MNEEAKSACFHHHHLETSKLEMEEEQIKTDIGIIRTSLNLSWVIRNYFSLPQEPGWCLLSPEFTFLGVKWWLVITQIGYPSSVSSDWISLSAVTSSNIPIHRISCKMSIDKNNDEEYFSHKLTMNFQRNCTNVLLLRSRLLRDKDEFILNGNLTFHCLFKAEDGKIGMSDAEDSAGITTVEVEKDSKTECSLAEDKETLPNPIGIFKLAQDLKELLLKESHFDTTIKIKDREFRAHRAILSSRSPVFASMFRHNTTERNTGTIEIEDCEPEEFQEFLSFLYSGVLENLTSENVFDIYTLADKYDVQEVKVQCLEFITNNLSVDNFCDVITLALRHSESQLLETAKKYFVQNTKKIVVTVKWLCFHKEYPVESNELYIKSLDYRDPQCDFKKNG